jgi:hypothetical protein
VRFRTISIADGLNRLVDHLESWGVNEQVVDADDRDGREQRPLVRRAHRAPSHERQHVRVHVLDDGHRVRRRRRDVLGECVMEPASGEKYFTTSSL